MSDYPYAEGALLDNPQSYQYTAYIGEPLLQAWIDSRNGYLFNLPKALLPEIDINSQMDVSTTHSRLSMLCHAARCGVLASDELESWLLIYISKFEVSKRLYSRYDNSFPHRANIESGYINLQPYLYLAECLIRKISVNNDCRYLNCLLKLCDTLSAESASITLLEGAYLAWILIEERRCVLQLRTRLGV